MGELQRDREQPSHFKQHLKGMLNDRTLAWVILNSIGWGLLNLFIWGAFDLERGTWRAADASNDLRIIATYTLIGLAMGITQWPVLHFVIPRAFLWILATAGGAGLGGLAARVLFGSTELVNDLVVIMFFVAFLQALVFWPISRKAYWWIPAKIIGLSFSPYAVPVSMSDNASVLALTLGIGSPCGFILSASFIFAGVPFAFITAYGLAVILSGARDRENTA